MKNVTIYHNPRCSKSREALQLLVDNDIQPTVIEYLKTPLNVNEIKKLLKLLAIKPREIMRKNETLYKTLNLENEKLSDEKLINALVENPILIERPIVVVKNKAVIGRPPEKVLELI